jgi:hypothetical protein
MERTPGDASVTANWATSTHVFPPHTPPVENQGGSSIYISTFYVLHLLIHQSILDNLGRLTKSSRPQINFTSMTDSNLPRIPDSIDIQRLQAMQLVAKMKESAEKHGIGFIGGFISPDGQKFVMTNMDDDDAMALMPEDLK